MKTKKAEKRGYKRMVLSSEPNCGKTTGAVNISKNAFWIDLDKRIPEDLLQHCEVNEVEQRKFTDVTRDLRDILKMDKITWDMVVIDTVTNLETFGREHSIEQDYGGNSKQYGSYSQGDKQSLPIQMNTVLSLLDRIAEKHGCDILLICHTEIKKVKNPNGEDYDKNTLLLTDKVRSRVIQWCDYLGFAWKKVEVAKEGLSAKATGSSERVISFSNDPRFDAKGPADLPAEIPFDIKGDWVKHIKTTKETK